MIDQTKHTAQTAMAKFGREMRPCPHCGGYNLIARLWMKLDWDGRAEEGIAYIVCDGCRWKPIKIVDFKGRMLDDVYKNHAIHDEVINLWNSQEGTMKFTKKPAFAAFGKPVSPCPHCGGDNIIIVMPEKEEGRFATGTGPAHIECSTCGHKGEPTPYSPGTDYEGKRRVWRALAREWNKAVKSRIS